MSTIYLGNLPAPLQRWLEHLYSTQEAEGLARQAVFLKYTGFEEAGEVFACRARELDRRVLFPTMPHQWEARPEAQDLWPGWLKNERDSRVLGVHAMHLERAGCRLASATFAARSLLLSGVMNLPELSP